MVLSAYAMKLKLILNHLIYQVLLLFLPWTVLLLMSFWVNQHFVKECSIDKQFKIESKMNNDKCASNNMTDRNLTGNISEMKQEYLKFTTQSVSTVETRI